MNHQVVKIYNTNDFKQTTKGIKVAQFMRLKPSSKSIFNIIVCILFYLVLMLQINNIFLSVLDTKKIINNFEDLVISNSLCCSYCNTVFADKYQQRTHYKLDWHRFNLKQHLHGLKSVSEDIFKVMIDKNDLSSSNSEEDAQSEDDSISLQLNENKKMKKKPIKQKIVEYKLDSSDEDCTEDDDVMNKNDILSSIGTRHSKVFFENEEGNIFSIYRCLLHNKKVYL